jgi:hypothetical protein
MDPKTAAPGDI